jgi:hypothetical protein
VVGSPILTPQVTYPQMIVMMKQMRRLPLLWLRLLFLHCHHLHHPLHTYASWLRVTER